MLFRLYIADETLLNLALYKERDMKRLLLIAILVCYVWCACSSCSARDTASASENSAELAEPQAVKVDSGAATNQAERPLELVGENVAIPVDAAKAETGNQQNGKTSPVADTPVTTIQGYYNEQQYEQPAPTSEDLVPFVPESNGLPMSGNNGGGDWGEIDP